MTLADAKSPFDEVSASAVIPAEDSAPPGGLPSALLLVDDDFGDERVFGTVVGSTGGGSRRGGRDDGRLLAVDNGALRIRPPLGSGWGRAVLAYGPFTPTPGLTLTLDVLNGHNSSENTDPWPSVARIAGQWLRSCHVESPTAMVRAYARQRSPREPWRRRVRAVRGARRAQATATTTDLNMAAGFFGAEVPSSAVAGGTGFSVRALGPGNGELGVELGGGRLPVVHGLQNVPLQLVVVVRRDDVMLLGASLPGAHGLGDHPRYRPLAVDPRPLPAAVWAGLQQSVLGQIAWSVDTRLRRLRVAQIPELAGEGALSELCAGPGDPGLDGRLIDLGRPAGLVVARLDGPATLVLRATDPDNGWFVHVESQGVAVELVRGGLVTSRHQRPVVGGPGADGGRHLQVLDDGRSLTVTLDGRPVDGGPIVSAELGDARCVGTARLAPGGVVHLEAFARDVELPDICLLDPATAPAGEHVAICEAFDGAGPLERRPVEEGHPRWERTLGTRSFQLTGQAGDGRGLVVPPWAVTPSGGIFGAAGRVARLPIRAPRRRTAYTTAWSDPDMADVEVDILPPGQQQGEGMAGRAGLIFWADERNYLTISTWLDDNYEGTSVSSFLRVDGFEDLYDAVWTNVGRRITWGRPYRFRVAFDGLTYCASVDGEPVLYRRVTDVYRRAGRLAISRVGIVANWEFGDDTGSRFRSFEGRSGRPEGI